MAITGVVGERIRTSINHFNPDNTPITGASFAVLEAHRPDGGTFHVEISEIGNGLYEAVLQTTTSDPPGEWFLLVEADNGYVYEEIFDILGSRPQIIQSQGLPQHGASRLQLRTAIATKLGDLTVVTATRNGTDSMVWDEVGLAREANAFNAMQIYCVDAQAPENIGHIGTVVSNNPGDRTVNFIPPLPHNTMAGDVFHLYNYRDTGWTVEEYNRAINDAIMRGGEDHATLPYSAVVDSPYSRTNNTIEIPQEFTRFSGVDVIERGGGYKSVPFRYYEVDPYLGELRLKGPYLQRAHGRKLRLRGYRKPDLLHTDDARTGLASEWVIDDAVALLIQSDVTSGHAQGGRDRLVMMARGGADGRRTTIMTTYAPNTVKMMRG